MIPPSATHPPKPAARSKPRSGVTRWVVLWTTLVVSTLATLALHSAMAANPMSGSPFISEDGDIQVHASQLLPHVPDSGTFPIALTLINKSPMSRKVTLTWEQTAGSTAKASRRWDFTLAPASSTEQLLIPSLVLSRNGNSQTMEGTIVGSTSTGRNFHFWASSTGYSGTQLPIHILAARFPASTIDKLTKESESKKASYGPPPHAFAGWTEKELPLSWDAYLGARSVAITPEDFTLLSQPSRAALLEWVAMGGNLLYCIANTASVDLPMPRSFLISSERKLHGFGLGTCQLVTLDADGSVPYSTYSTRFLSGNPHANGTDTTTSVLNDSEIGLTQNLPRPEVPKTLTFALLVGFALVMGPLNLFVLARSHRRIRLFVTTPLLSLGLAGIGILSILLADGAGGKGNRVTLIANLSGLPRQFVLQEQLARCGMLLRTRFTPIPTPDTYCIQHVADELLGDRPELTIEPGDRYSGTWFKSRSRQGMEIRRFQPGRSTFELRGAATSNPLLISSFPATIDVALLLAPDGSAWQAEQVRPGDGATLGKLTDGDARKLKKRLVDRAGGRGQSLLRDFLNQDAEEFSDTKQWRYLGFREGAAENAVATLESVKWRDATLYAGTINP